MTKPSHVSKPELEPSHFIKLPRKSTLSTLNLGIPESLIQLHEDMINFNDFMQATPAEFRARVDVIVRMKSIAEEIGMNALFWSLDAMRLNLLTE